MKKKLQQIAEHLDRINRDLRKEGEVWDAELRDRRAKGLEGEAAIEHYNAWMAASGMEHNDQITWDNLSHQKTKT